MSSIVFHAYLGTRLYGYNGEAIDLYVNDQKINHLKNNEAIKYPISAGEHTIQGRIKKAKSTPVLIEVKEGEQKHYRVKYSTVLPDIIIASAMIILIMSYIIPALKASNEVALFQICLFLIGILLKVFGPKKITIQEFEPQQKI